MSEPVSNVEIEDVLSSIRRLVSEENRPPIRPEQPAKVVMPDRLVLTPALRVAAPPEPSPLTLTDPVMVGDVAIDTFDFNLSKVKKPAQEPVAEQAVFDPTALPTEQPFVQVAEAGAEADIDTVPDSEAVSETGAEVDHAAQGSDGFVPALERPKQTDTPESDNEGAPWRDPNATLFEAVEPTSQPTDEEPADGQPADDDFFTVPESKASTREPAEDPDLQIDELAEAINDDPAEDVCPSAASFEQHLVQDAPVDNSPTDTGPDTGPDDATLLNAEVAPDTKIEETLVVSDDPSDAATLSAKIAALEATIGQTLDQWEPDGDSRDEYAGTPVETLQWQDHTAESSVEPEQLYPDLPGYNAPPGPETPEDSSKDDSLDEMAGNDAILDEESLRELVADIVREELQGALGERITRNVRKLVRREIHRALTTQQLD